MTRRPAEISAGRSSVFVQAFRGHFAYQSFILFFGDDLIDFDRCKILYIQAFAAVVANLIRIQIAHFTLQATDTIPVIQHTFLRFHSLTLPMLRL